MSDLWTEKYKFQHRIQGLVNGLSADIAETLEGALENVSGRIIVLESKSEQTKSLVHKRKYLDQQKAEIEKVSRSVYQDIGEDIKSKSIELAQATPEIIDSMIKAPGISIKLGVPNLDKKRVTAWFESSQIEGTYFNDWMKKLEGNAAARIVKETRESLILSESLRETTKRIQAALDVGRRSAEGLAHNSLHQAFNWAERQYYLENESKIEAIRFTAELDRQTTPLCRSLDGKQFPLNEAPVPPLHWKCRSMLMPIFRNKALNEALRTSEGNVRIARIDTAPRTVHHRDGTTSTKYEKLRVKHPHADTTYNQWMSSMIRSKDPRDVGFAREVLGKSRYNLIKSGKLKMESLYYHGKLRTIKELKRLK